MKYKNYKSAIHNFAHSFQSIDYMKSGKLAINTLIHLNNLDRQPTAKFNFIAKTVEPDDAILNESKKLLNDYLDWLPTHFKNHNCDINKLEKLEITISADFEKAFTPTGMKKCKQITISTITNWKAEKRNEETIEISQDEIIDENYLKIGMPEF